MVVKGVAELSHPAHAEDEQMCGVYVVQSHICSSIIAWPAYHWDPNVRMGYFGTITAG